MKTAYTDQITKRINELVADIKYYIDEGINKKRATEMVLDDSTIGKAAKAQIEYEIKYYNNQ